VRTVGVWKSLGGNLSLLSGLGGLGGLGNDNMAVYLPASVIIEVDHLPWDQGLAVWFARAFEALAALIAPTVTLEVFQQAFGRMTAQSIRRVPSKRTSPPSRHLRQSRS
jgi:hypothetical protein